VEERYEDRPDEHDVTILDIIARWMQALWTWARRAARDLGRWVKKRARLAWIEREIMVLRGTRNESLLRLGECVYKAFRNEVMGRPELTTQIDQIQQLELDLARKRRLKDRVERDEVA